MRIITTSWGSCSWSRRSRRLWRRLSRLLHPSTKPLKQQTSHKTLSMFVVACFGDDVGGLDQPLWLLLQQPRQWSREPARLGIILVQPGARADPTDEGSRPGFHRFRMSYRELGPPSVVASA